MATEKLEQSLVDNLKNLNYKKNELIVKTGEVHLEIKQLSQILTMMENEYIKTSTELNKILADLEEKYPNGEVDLVEGTVNF